MHLNAFVIALAIIAINLAAVGLTFLGLLAAEWLAGRLNRRDDARGRW